MPAVQVADCQTAEDVWRIAREVAARRKASRIKPKVMMLPAVKPLLPTQPEPPRLTIGGAPVKSNLTMVLEFARGVREVNPGAYILPIPERPKIDDIISATAAHFGLPVHELLDDRRARPISRARQVAMYLAKTLTFRSLPEIGRKLGGRDHTTVLWGIRKITSLLECGDTELAAAIAALTARLERK